MNANTYNHLYFNPNYDMDLYNFYCMNTLNIFSDASVRRKGKNSFDTCYSVVAVNENTIIDSDTRIISNSTNNGGEIRGLRLALSIANKWINQYDFINIFSDSKISIIGLREYIYNWRYDKKTGKLINSSGSIVSNQEVFIECYYLLSNLDKLKPNRVQLFHQRGHINNNIKSLCKARESFKKENHINADVNLNLINYLSTWNNYVDYNSRSTLRRTSSKIDYTDAIEFGLNGPLIK